LLVTGSFTINDGKMSAVGTLVSLLPLQLKSKELKAIVTRFFFPSSSLACALLPQPFMYGSITVHCNISSGRELDTFPSLLFV
jgi:hypothetical protein